jgi:hypothetical protein
VPKGSTPSTRYGGATGTIDSFFAPYVSYDYSFHRPVVRAFGIPSRRLARGTPCHTRALARAHFHFVSAFVRTGREIRLKRTSDDWTMLFERIARSKQSVGIRLFIFTRQSRPDVRRGASTERTNERISWVESAPRSRRRRLSRRSVRGHRGRCGWVLRFKTRRFGRDCGKKIYN